MKPSFIKGIGQSYEKKLRRADITQAEELRHIDVDALSEKTGISAQRLKEWKKKAVNTAFLSDIEGIGTATEKKLHKAGVHDYNSLQRADIKKLEKRTGIDGKKLETWQQAASRLAGGPIMKARLVTDQKKPSISSEKEGLWYRFKEWLKG